MDIAALTVARVSGPGLRMTHSNGARQMQPVGVKQALALALTLDQVLRPLQTTLLEMPVQISQTDIAALTVAHASGLGLRMTHSNGAQRTPLADVKLAKTQDRVPHHHQTIPTETLVEI